MRSASSSKRSLNIGFILIAALVSCYAAFHNGFPLVYSDTGTYIRSGFEGEIPMGRPIFYGLFIRHISLAESLWLVVFVQSMITSWLLHLITGILFSGVKRNVIFLISIVLVTLTTGYSYNVSILIPDIFATIAFLAALVLLFSQELSRWKWIVISVIFVFSLSTHYSNIPIFILLFAVLFFSYWRKKRKGSENLPLKRILITLSLFLFTMIMIPTVNYSYNGKFRYSESSHVFLFNHMIEIGAAQEYLDDNCDKNDFAICAYREELEWDFLWNYNSPLYKTGGWEKNEADFNEINAGIITTPKYWPLLGHKTIEYTLKQMFFFETTIQPVKYEETPDVEIIEYLKNSKREYRSGKQLQGKQDVTRLNSVEGIVVFISSILILAVLVLNKSLGLVSDRFKNLLQLLVAYTVVNAMVCANLSTVINRYQNRWAWMLVIAAVFIAVSFYDKRKELSTAR